MLRWIAAGVVLTCSLLAAAPVPKPTERELAARWGEIVKCKDDDVQYAQGRITLIASPKPVWSEGLLHLEAGSQSVQTRQKVEGDFELTVFLRSLTADGPPDQPKAHPETVSGIFARDAENVLVISWCGTIFRRGKIPFCLRWMVKECGSTATNSESSGIAESGVWLRIHRRDDNLTVGISPDGKKWDNRSVVKTVFGGKQAREQNFAPNVEVGVFVKPDPVATVRATFSDFKLATRKK